MIYHRLSQVTATV